jgi:hypothetical protein
MQDLIRKAQEFFGVERLSGGNCGQFALALAHLSKSKIGLIFNDSHHINIETLKDLLDAETDVYHVFVETAGGEKYDGTGKIDNNVLFSIAHGEYNDDNPGYFSDININDPMLLSIVRNETNWDIHVSEFLEIMGNERI